MTWLYFAIGVFVVAFATVSLVSTFVLPRGGSKVQALPLVGSRLLIRPGGKVRGHNRSRAIQQGEAERRRETAYSGQRGHANGN